MASPPWPTPTTAPTSTDAYREAAVLAAYAAGVDQLIARSLRSRELTSRIRAMLRRTPPRPRGIVGIVGVDADGAASISVDLATCAASVRGMEVSLTPDQQQPMTVLSAP